MTANIIFYGLGLFCGLWFFMESYEDKLDRRDKRNRKQGDEE